MITDLRNSQYHATGVESITARIEMLDIGTKEEQKLRRSIQKRILQSLHYPALTHRYEEVLQAHPKTFDWIFADGVAQPLPWNNFTKWLREDGGIYWINGKAGSGKSTLMKHIYDDFRTRTCLQQWGQNHRQPGEEIEVSLATFFFWNCGTEMQKSRLGLFRSLLFQVLGKRPDLIPVCFPTRWMNIYSGTLDLGEEDAGQPWSLRELSESFKRLICQKEAPVKLCFLIDGLDEFGGDTLDLCSLLQEISVLNSNAKFCVSSRPWIEFQDTFEGAATLRLQDLTFNDINIYVNDKFRQTQAFKNLGSQNPTLVSDIIDETVERAEGVFLWVQVNLQGLRQIFEYIGEYSYLPLQPLGWLCRLLS